MAWSAIKSLPISLQGHYGFVSVGKYAYIVGGQTASGYNRNIYMYDSQSDSWSIKSIMPLGYYITTAFSAGNKIYGFTWGASNLNIYDTVTDTWMLGAKPPRSTEGNYDDLVYANSGNKVYVFYTYSGKRNISVYDVDLDFWDEMEPIPYPDRYRFNVGQVDNTIYVIGGMDNATERGLDRVDSFNTIIGVWNESVPMIDGKYYFTVGTSESEIYAIAGIIDSARSSDVQVYDTIAKSWRRGLSAPTDSSTFAVTCENIIVCIGRGLSGNHDVYYTLDTRQANITNPSPASGFVNDQVSNVFSWNLRSMPLSSQQISAIFQWRTKNSPDVNTIYVTTEKSVTIPGNTLPNGLFEWRVQAKSSNEITTPFTDWIELTTIDAIPDKPIGLFPSSGMRDGTRPIQFYWIHRNQYSTPQHAFEIQTTYDNGLTWNDISGKVYSPDQQYIAPENSIVPINNTGQVGWRVRTYNTEDVASQWSDTAFIIVHAAPQPPRWISVESNRSRPLTRWTSFGQIGFQLQVIFGESIVFDSIESFGVETEYRIPQFLRNGSYIFRLRIKNVRGLWSEWADFPVSINARQTLTINLSGESIKNGAQLNFNADVR